MADKGPKMVEIRDKSDDELQGALDRARDELFRLRLGRVTNQVQNVMEIRNKRKEIARILTVMTERRKGQAPVAQAKE